MNEDWTMSYNSGVYFLVSTNHQLNESVTSINQRQPKRFSLSNQDDKCFTVADE